ncbi:MAG: hypothetical protein MRZ98_08055, partial [Clostridiales bacterium]|nr:hypothetical protein [Clostridiales bacterium]
MDCHWAYGEGKQKARRIDPDGCTARLQSRRANVVLFNPDDCVAVSSDLVEVMPYLNEEIIYSLRNCLLHQSTPNVEQSKIHESRCKVDKFELVITGEDGANGDL